MKKAITGMATLIASLFALPLQAATWETGKYGYDGTGNIKSIGPAEVFRYDTVGRLLRGTGGSGHEQVVTYDRYGNIKSMKVDGGPTINFGVEDSTNRLADPTKNVFGTYDTAGRLQAELGGAGNTFTFDVLDTVTHSDVDDVAKVHLYNTSGERIASVTSGGQIEGPSEWTLRDLDGKVIRRLRKNGASWTWVQDYVHHGSRVLAAELSNQETYHFFTDHLGSPRLTTGNGGVRIAAHDYYPFGGEITEPAQDVEKLKFTAHERDSESLDYMMARYYQPRWGRFHSIDPAMTTDKNLLSPQRWNRYSYATNNPIRYIDPDGRDGWDIARKGLEKLPSATVAVGHQVGAMGGIYGVSLETKLVADTQGNVGIKVSLINRFGVGFSLSSNVTGGGELNSTLKDGLQQSSQVTVEGGKKVGGGFSLGLNEDGNVSLSKDTTIRFGKTVGGSFSLDGVTSYVKTWNIFDLFGQERPQTPPPPEPDDKQCTMNTFTFTGGAPAR